MIPWTLAEIATVTGGRLADATGTEVVSGPATVDSRSVVAGGLFVAVPGEHVDGHDYTRRAVEAGAAGVLAARPTGAPSVLVGSGSHAGSDLGASIVTALGQLAHVVLAAAPLVRVTAVTGSSGKTSTKDLLAQLLTSAGPTVATHGSYNNDLGLPLTVLRIDADTRQLVLEMGSRAIGDIARLCRIATPHTGIVLNVGLAHVGEFGGLDRTALAKGELVEALPADGVAVLNADDPRVLGMRSRTQAQVVTFGVDSRSGVDITAEQVRLDEEGRARFELRTPVGSADVELQLVGAHHVPNALAATAAGIAAGLGVEEIAAGLRAARPRSGGRMEVVHRSDGVTVVNDAYNANPDSTRAALHALVALGRASRTWAVLGEMLELGPGAADEHASIGRLAVALDVDRLVVIGAGAESMHVAAVAAAPDEKRSVFVTDVDGALDLLRRELRPGDAVLVKASHSMGLGRLGEQLAADVPLVIAILTGGAIALVIALFGTPIAIRLLVRKGYGQLIRDDGPTSHHTKRGTPTMGGAVIILATLGGYLVAHLVAMEWPTASGLLVLFLMVGLGLVGFVDDYIKVSKQRSLGLRAGAKFIGQGLVAIVFAIGALQFENERGLTPASEAVSFVRDTGLVLGPVLFVVWAFIMIAATSNGVNLTDGLDGLATGASSMAAAAYMLIASWQLGQSCEFTPFSECYQVRDSRDLAIIAASLVGACFGFLWWNASPAKIFMGDTGSLALGGAFAGLAITTRTELLLVVIGGLFAVITASVIIQVGYFKMTHRRVFRMAPLQHHFELKGWGEVTIVIRFWIIAGLCVALGLGVFYADWVASV